MTFDHAIEKLNLENLNAVLDEERIGVLMDRQIQWSRDTFGEGRRTFGLTGHIRKELQEILSDPRDHTEWVDVILLAMDGYWRSGGADLASDIRRKQDVNRSRQWPVPGPGSEHNPAQHIEKRDARIDPRKDDALEKETCRTYRKRTVTDRAGEVVRYESCGKNFTTCLASWKSWARNALVVRTDKPSAGSI